MGPFTPGFVADQSLASQLAEVGVILLMFGVGLHFSLKDLLSVRRIAIPGAIAQMAVATLLGIGLAWLFGWSVGGGLVFGLALSVASTVVLIRALQERHLIDSEQGRIALGWLIVEDLAMVVVLVLLPVVAGLLHASVDASAGDGADALRASRIAATVGLTLLKAGLFVAVMLVIGRRAIPLLFHYVAHTGSRELFRLAVLAVALGVAFGAAELFGVSFALGAFFAGMVLSESELSQRAAERVPAAAGCLCGSVLRFRRHAVRPGGSGTGPLAGGRDGSDHRARQIDRGVFDGAGLRPPVAHRAHDLGEARRELVEQLRARGLQVIHGNAADRSVLKAAKSGRSGRAVRGHPRRLRGGPDRPAGAGRQSGP